jgi:hypothetical protein
MSPEFYISNNTTLLMSNFKTSPIKLAVGPKGMVIRTTDIFLGLNIPVKI